jgi:hypothetical protein
METGMMGTAGTMMSTSGISRFSGMNMAEGKLITETLEVANSGPMGSSMGSSNADFEFQTNVLRAGFMMDTGGLVDTKI